MDKISKNRKIFAILCIASILIGVILFAIIMTNIPDAAMIISLYIGAVIIGLIAYNYHFIRKPFKEMIIPEILKKHKPTLEFIPTLKIKEHYEDLIINHRLIPAASSFQFNDGIIDEVLGYKVTSFDLHATHTQSTGKSSTTVTDFKGRFYDIEFDMLPCSFIIKEEFLKRVPDEYEFLELELIDFNKVFNLYVTNKHEAFKIFTPTVIKKYYNLAGIDYDNTILHYQDNHLYVYIHNEEDLFENMDDDFEKIIIEEYEKQYNNVTHYINVFQYEKIENI